MSLIITQAATGLIMEEGKQVFTAGSPITAVGTTFWIPTRPVWLVASLFWPDDLDPLVPVGAGNISVGLRLVNAVTQYFLSNVAIATFNAQSSQGGGRLGPAATAANASYNGTVMHSTNLTNHTGKPREMFAQADAGTITGTLRWINFYYSPSKRTLP